MSGNGRVNPEEIAGRLEDAWRDRRPIPPLSESLGLDSAETAYAIQTAWSRMRLAGGERVLGHKIGLTSQAMRDQLSVHEPDYGQLWESRFYPAKDGTVTVPAGVFVQPRVESELAFLLGAPLEGTGITRDQVVAATEAVAVSIEIIDSRITDWRIRLVDTVADNASYGAFTLGPWDPELVTADLRTLGMIVTRNGGTEVEAVGHAVLGDPYLAVAWLANKLNGLGTAVKAGDIVLSGSLGKAIPAAHGDTFTVETYGQPALTAIFG
ncbi:MAG: 2-hydroxypenta-2,4-dienoate hydratase [Streptosporangiales bacterium]|nr:2-hydroxypenta-2,4-dienoate hydratase [Streptosporangiales bacterium]